MRSNNSNGSRASSARGFVALCAMLALGLPSMARPAAAAPFAYVANFSDGTVSVIDTATNTVVTGTGFPIPVGRFPAGVAVTPDGTHVYVANNNAVGTASVIDTATTPPSVTSTVTVGNGPAAGIAVTPDGKHVYVANQVAGKVSVIDTTTNPPSVVATVPVGTQPHGVAVTPDGKHVYVANYSSGNVSVIATATNKAVATITGVNLPVGLAVTPDGKHVYVGNSFGTNVSVIDTTTNPPSVTATVAVGFDPLGVAVAPDGKHAYVANGGDGTVSAIDTTTNPPSVAATVPVGRFPGGVAVTPDGKHAYVENQDDNSVSVIDTASNTVVATVTVGANPDGVGIVPPPAGVPFLAFKVKLEIDLDRKPNEDRFELISSFTLSSTASINPPAEPVTLQVGTFTTTVPPGSFKKRRDENEPGFFSFEGVINGVRLEALIKRTGTLRYAFEAEARDANLAGTKNPVPVMLTIGDDSGTASVKARISR